MKKCIYFTIKSEDMIYESKSRSRIIEYDYPFLSFDYAARKLSQILKIKKKLIDVSAIE